MEKDFQKFIKFTKALNSDVTTLTTGHIFTTAHGALSYVNNGKHLKTFLPTWAIHLKTEV
jgi:hypothetical protein